jgi:hypothetical protein
MLTRMLTWISKAAFSLKRTAIFNPSLNWFQPCPISTGLALSPRAYRRCRCSSDVWPGCLQRDCPDATSPRTIRSYGKRCLIGQLKRVSPLCQLTCHGLWISGASWRSTLLRHYSQKGFSGLELYCAQVLDHSPFLSH